MTATLNEIKEMYDRAPDGTSHMIVALDSFDYENYPIYVPEGSDPRTYVPTNGDRVDECYRLSLGWDSQSKERRARHWEFE